MRELKRFDQLGLQICNVNLYDNVCIPRSPSSLGLIRSGLYAHLLCTTLQSVCLTRGSGDLTLAAPRWSRTHRCGSLIPGVPEHESHFGRLNKTRSLLESHKVSRETVLPDHHPSSPLNPDCFAPWPTSPRPRSRPRLLCTSSTTPGFSWPRSS